MITSTANPRIKNVVRLSASRRHRNRLGLTLVEGAREVRRCLDAGVTPKEIYICRELAGTGAPDLLARLEGEEAAPASPRFYVSPQVFAKMAVRGESGGLLLVIPYLPTGLESLRLSANPFLAVVEGAEKPGNLGAILRTADAAGVDGLLVAFDPGQGVGTDLHNPNVIRASLGARFTVPCAAAPSQRLIPWLRARGIQIVAAGPQAPTIYTQVDLTGPVAIVTGSEAHGLSQIWWEAADLRVRIPMFGVVDSLNLAASTALLLYEVVRQRGRG